MPDLEPIKPNRLGNVLLNSPGSNLHERIPIYMITLSQWKKSGSYFYYIDLNKEGLVDNFNNYLIEVFPITDKDTLLLNIDRNNSSSDQLRVVTNISVEDASFENKSIDANFRFLSKSIQSKKGQRAQGVNNTDCIRLGIIKDNEKKYISRIAFYKNAGEVNYISRRLVERVINPYSLYGQSVTNTLGVGALVSSISGTIVSILIDPRVTKIWMGWTPFESENVWGDKPAVFDVGDHKRAYGIFNFDVTPAGGSGTDLCEFFLMTLAKGYSYFNRWASYKKIPNDVAEREHLASTFNDLENDPSIIDSIVKDLAAMLTIVAANHYLTGGTNVIGVANKLGLDIYKNTYSEKLISALVGSLWSHANRCGGGKFLNSIVSAMADSQRAGNQFLEVVKAGYHKAWTLHTDPNEKPRWNPENYSYDSEYYALSQYVNGNPPEKYKKEISLVYDPESLQDGDVSFSTSTDAPGYSYIASGLLMLTPKMLVDNTSGITNYAYEFGFYGNKDFTIDLNIFSTNYEYREIDPEKYYFNILYNGITSTENSIPIKWEDYRVSEGSGYLLYVDSRSNKIYFRFFNGKEIFEINTKISLTKSLSEDSYNKLKISVRKLYNNSNNTVKFLFYKNDALTATSEAYYLDSSYILKLNTNRLLLLGESPIDNKSTFNFYDKIQIKGVSPRIDVVNIYSKDLGLGFYRNQLLESDE